MGALLNPTLLISLLLSIGYASLFHLWTGRSLRELVVYLLAAMVGFGLGQWLAQTTAFDLFQIGQLHIVESTIGAFLALFIARTLTA